MNKTCIIAEIGTSHQGDLNHAIELIHAAKEAGADTAKFQWIYADEIIHKKTGVVSLPTGDIPLYDRFRALEQKPEFFARLKEECEKLKLEFLCTPFGTKSALQLWKLGVKRFKVASPELNHLPLLELLGATGCDLIVSSGVSRLADIEEALETISESRLGNLPHLAAIDPAAYKSVLRLRPSQTNSLTKVASELQRLHGGESGASITLLHCMTAYPAPESEYNLLLIRTLKSIFGLATGISDHSMDPILVPAISTILGGQIIEKHFTLSNDSLGLDDPIALNPIAFQQMVQAVRKIESTLPNPVEKRTYPQITASGNAVAYVIERLGEANIEIQNNTLTAILGNGIKNLAPTEKANYGRTNRTIHARRHLSAGTILGIDDISILRTEKILRPGLHPRHVLQVLGHTLQHDVDDGEGIRWQDILQ